MQKFRFTLQAVQVVRQQAENKALEAYARALGAQQQAEAAWRETHKELENAWQRRRDMECRGACAVWLVQVQNWCAALEERCRAQEQAIEKARQQTALAWSRLALARRQREALDKLRQRQRHAHETAVQREEQKILDELATLRFLNNSETLNLRDWTLPEPLEI